MLTQILKSLTPVKTNHYFLKVIKPYGLVGDVSIRMLAPALV